MLAWHAVVEPEAMTLPLRDRAKELAQQRRGSQLAIDEAHLIHGKRLAPALISLFGPALTDYHMRAVHWTARRAQRQRIGKADLSEGHRLGPCPSEVLNDRPMYRSPRALKGREVRCLTRCAPLGPYGDMRTPWPVTNALLDHRPTTTLNAKMVCSIHHGCPHGYAGMIHDATSDQSDVPQSFWALNRMANVPSLERSAKPEFPVNDISSIVSPRNSPVSPPP